MSEEIEVAKEYVWVFVMKGSVRLFIKANEQENQDITDCFSFRDEFIEFDAEGVSYKINSDEVTCCLGGAAESIKNLGDQFYLENEDEQSSDHLY